MKVTADELRARKGRGSVPALTAYDFPMARLIDEAGVPFILVGDSLGMVVLGYPDTTHVTMAHMIHHVEAVARVRPNALVGADLPYKSYENAGQALENARLLIAAGADAVKAEGGRSIISQVKAITGAGIPFCGHLGMLPQSVLEEGGYRKKGRTELERHALVEDARALADAGAFAIVLELVIPEVAKLITESISIPTIGIGSGPDCDGQILVTHDLVGAFPWFTPRFVQPKVQTGALIRQAINDWKNNL
ncbi:MAG: 3-methyl-2-oxobutanoate hydroxymethyltransferase [Verrucomicrobiota bacterium]|nr:3-methyl-2-oxobutanoate hydroxymethyltransferase [Verrucomicrobiota bacterium]